MPPARSCLAVLALCAALPARAGDAFDQLCTAAGGNCNVHVPAPPPPTPVDTGRSGGGREAKEPQRQAPKPKPRGLTQSQQLQVTVVGTLLEGFLQGMLSGPPKQDAAAAEAARLREIELLRQRAEQVREQRSRREQENEAGLEAMRSALAEPFDVGGGGLAEPVRLEPGAGTVGLFAPPENPFARPAPERKRSEGAERLAAAAAENEDVAVLQARLSGLEERLAEERARALDLKRSANALVREYEAHEETVTRTVDEAKERGLSMAFEGLLKLDRKALDALGQVRSNGRAWNTMTGLLRDTDRGARALLDAGDAAGETVGDARWLLQDRNLRQDLTYLGERLGGPYWEHGSSIVASASAIRQQLAAMRRMRELSGISASYRAEVAAGAERMAALQQELRSTRELISRKTGIPAAELPRAAPPGPVAPTRLGSPVPHPLD